MTEKQKLTYAGSGVDIEAGDAFAAAIRSHMRRTHGPRVIQNDGGFAGLFRLDYNEAIFKRNFKDPVLVACTDGVGTKVEMGRETDRYEELGIDLVAMSVNDLVVQGAEPLLFLDYIACGKVIPERLERIVAGMSDALASCNCALIGGETAEMNDVYGPDGMDLAGFALGVVELERAMDPSRVEAGDVVIGLESDGIHSNGFSLVRAIVREAKLDLGKVYEELDAERTLGEVLMTPTRVYAGPIAQLLRRYTVKKIVSGMAHITGGGIPGNLNRALHDKVDAVLDRSSWEVPAVFRFLQEKGDISADEMDRVFNMGIGYCLVVRSSFAASVERQLRELGERPHILGEIAEGSGDVRLD
ncbi:MAG: phosphoribosylformylglycinamidine cyclo-ligase [Planctomycetota bacterium]